MFSNILKIKYIRTRFKFFSAWLLGVAAIETISVVLYALALPVAVMLVYRAVRDLNVDVLKKLYVVILSGAGGGLNSIYMMSLIF